MLSQIITIAFGSIMGLVNAILLAKYHRACKREDQRNDEIKLIQHDIAMLKAGYITEDKLRLALKEELKDAFKDFELRLINEGRLAPKRRTTNG
jgi:hypothetical protein